MPLSVSFRDIIPHDSGQDVKLVNFSPDWLTVYYRTPVSLGAWEALEEGFEVAACGLRWVFEPSKMSTFSRVSKCEGLSIKCLDPNTEWSEAGQLSGAVPQYPCEVQIQGHAWSMGVAPFELLAELERSLGLSAEARVCGRVDLASDFQMTQKSYDHLICLGTLSTIKANWVSRARNTRIDYTKGKGCEADEKEMTSAVLVKKKKNAVTLYLGSRVGLQIAIYRKDVAFAGNTGELLRDKWARNGWDGESPVVRVEVRVSRRWLTHHWFDEEYGGEVGPVVVIGKAGGLWRKATQDFRLAPFVPGRGEDSNKRRRPTSGVWAVVQRSWDGWVGCDDFATVEAVPSRTKLVLAAGKRIEDMRIAFAEDDFRAVLAELVRGLPQLGDYVRKTKWRKYAHARNETSNRHKLYFETASERGNQIGQD